MAFNAFSYFELDAAELLKNFTAVLFIDAFVLLAHIADEFEKENHRVFPFTQEFLIVDVEFLN